MGFGRKRGGESHKSSFMSIHFFPSSSLSTQSVSISIIFLPSSLVFLLYFCSLRLRFRSSFLDFVDFLDTLGYDTKTWEKGGIEMYFVSIPK